MNKQPLISVIIPVYNVELYIRNCLDSVVNQTYKNLEIIIINDATPDNSMAIVKKYAQKDARIKVINHIRNTGIGITRNDALSHATGDFIGFVDSDDTIDRRYYENLMKRQIETDSDIVMGSYITNAGFGKVFRHDVTVYKMEQKQKLSILWAGIYRHKLIKDNNIKFAQMGLGEDVIFGVKCAFFANHLSTCKDAIYFYEKLKSDSYTHSTPEEIKRIQKQIWELCSEFFQQQGWPKTYVNMDDMVKDDLALLHDIYPIQQNLPDEKATQPEKKKLYLFGFIPFFTVKSKFKNKSTWVLLFNFIPFIKVK